MPLKPNTGKYAVGNLVEFNKSLPQTERFDGVWVVARVNRKTYTLIDQKTGHRRVRSTENFLVPAQGHKSLTEAAKAANPNKSNTPRKVKHMPAPKKTVTAKVKATPVPTNKQRKVMIVNPNDPKTKTTKSKSAPKQPKPWAEVPTDFKGWCKFSNGTDARYVGQDTVELDWIVTDANDNVLFSAKTAAAAVRAATKDVL